MPKKTNSIKITDRKKPWLKKVKSSQYKIEVKEPKKTILIVTEGQTEKLYFDSFPVLTLTVKAVNLGQSKSKLIESTTSILEVNDYDEVWCVFDMDINEGKKEFSDFDNAIIKGEKLGYHIAYSNDSFELWYYLHFNYTEQQNLRGFYEKFLSNKWNINYADGGKKYAFCKTIYERLEKDGASQEKAIKNATKLFEKFKHLPFHQQNPVTKVYELVVYLNENKRQ